MADGGGDRDVTNNSTTKEYWEGFLNMAQPFSDEQLSHLYEREARFLHAWAGSLTS